MRRILLPIFLIFIQFNLSSQVTSVKNSSIDFCNPAIFQISNSGKNCSYFLRSSSNNSIVAGPILGNGDTLNLVTGNLSESQSLFISTEPAANQALNFDGSNDVVLFPNSNVYDITSVTIEAWVNSLNYGLNQFIFEKGPVNTQYSLFFDSGNLIFRTYDNTNTIHNTFIAVSSLGLVSNTSYHIACTFDGTTKKIFVNGVEKHSHNDPHTLATGNNGQSIGAFGPDAVAGFPSGGYFFNGTIDEVRIWNIARPADSLLAQKDIELIGSENGLIGYYQINDGTGSMKVTDLTSNNVTGTLTNMDSNSDWVSGLFTPSSVNSGCSSDSTLHNITVPQGKPSLSASNTTLCSPDSVQFSVSSILNGFSYSLKSASTGNIVDGPVSGNGNPITLTTPYLSAADSFYVFGEKENDGGGTALEFDGSNDYVQINSLTNLSGSEITIEYWFKGSSLHSAVRQQSGQNFIVAGWNNMHILSNDGSTSGISVGAAATDGNWHHIAMTWKQNTNDGFKSFLDGQLVAQRTSSNVALPNINAATYIGSLSGTGEFSNGQIDEVRIWNVARTQAEIQATKDSSIFGYASGLVAYYNFEEGSGTTLNDLTANNHTGTINSATNWPLSFNETYTCGDLYSDTVAINFTNLNLSNETFTANGDSICEGESVIFTLNSSQVGVEYFLTDASNNIYDLKSGTGSALTFNSGALTASNEFFIAAKPENSDLFGSALSFDGINDYVRLDSVTNLSGSEITIEYWFKGTSLQSAVRQQAPGADFIISGWQGKHILINDGSTTNGLSVGDSATNGKWHHVAMTWKQNTANGFASYLDGVLVEQRTSSNTPLPNLNTPVLIGSYTGFSEFTNGTIDNLRIWNVARTQSEINATKDNTLPGNTPGLIAAFDFDESDGGFIYDKKTNNPGALINEPTWLLNFNQNSNCSNLITDSVELFVSNIYIGLSKFNVTCRGGSDGEIRSNIANGALPYTYLWSNGSTTDSIINLLPDTYNLTVTDNLGCQREGSTSLVEAYGMGVSILGLGTLCDSSRTTTLIANHHTTYYSGSPKPGISNVTPSVLWNTGKHKVGQNKDTLINMSSGYYSAIFTNNLGCTDSASGNVYVHPEVSYSISPSETEYLATGDTTTFVASTSQNLDFLWYKQKPRSFDTLSTSTLSSTGHLYAKMVVDQNNNLYNIYRANNYTYVAKYIDSSETWLMLDSSNYSYGSVHRNNLSVAYDGSDNIYITYPESLGDIFSGFNKGKKATVEKFSLISNQISILGGSEFTSIKVGGAFVATHNQDVYIAFVEPNGIVSNVSVMKYDNQNNTWGYLGSSKFTPSSNSFYANSNLKISDSGEIYASDSKNNFFKYNSSTNSWSALSTAGLPSTSISNNFIEKDGDLYTYSLGSDPNTGLTYWDVFRYSASSNTWSNLNTNFSDVLGTHSESYIIFDDFGSIYSFQGAGSPVLGKLNMTTKLWENIGGLYHDDAEGHHLAKDNLGNILISYKSDQSNKTVIHKLVGNQFITSSDTLLATDTGKYFLRITNPSTSCEFIDQVNVLPQTGPKISITISQNNLCFGATNGKAFATATGGNTPYAYIWSNGQNTDTLSNVVANTYYVTVTDYNGDKDTAMFVITEQPEILNQALTASDSAVCLGNTTTISTASSEVGVYYSLINNSQVVVTDSILGTGNSISFVTTPILELTEFALQMKRGGCSVSNSTISIDLESHPKHELSANGSANCSGAPINLVLDTSYSYLEYSLFNENDSLISGPVSGTDSAIVFISDSLKNAANYYVSATQSTPGDFAIDFDDEFQYGVILSTPSFTAYTIEMWVKPQRTGFDEAILFYSTMNAGPDISHGLFINSNGKFYHRTNDGIDKTITGTTSITPNQWYHVAIVAENNDSMRLYVNGIQEGIPLEINTLWTGGNVFYISYPAFPFATDNFDGAIDELKIWGAAKSSSVITAGMNTNLMGNETDLTGYFKFNEGEGDIILNEVTQTFGIGLDYMDDSDWVVGLSGDTGSICTAILDTVSIPFDTLEIQTLSTKTSQVCNSQSTTVSTSSSQVGATYYLFNSNRNLVDGPKLGTGDSLHFGTGQLTSNITFFLKAGFGLDDGNNYFNKDSIPANCSEILDSGLTIAVNNINNFTALYDDTVCYNTAP